jgi:CheY-like chemotaxis protein
MSLSSGLYLKGKTILVVEDDYVCYQLIKELLSDTEVEILHALTAAKAVETVAKRPKIDLVLMDIQLPDMNGLQASMSIKNISRAIPIVIQTAYAFDSYIQKSKEIGCDGFIVKPVEAQKIFDTVKKFLTKR